MEKEARPKEVAYAEKYKDCKVDNEIIKKLIQLNKSDIFLVERGTCRVDDTPKEYMILKVYFDIKDLTNE